MVFSLFHWDIFLDLNYPFNNFFNFDDFGDLFEFFELVVFLKRPEKGFSLFECDIFTDIVRIHESYDRLPQIFFHSIKACLQLHFVCDLYQI